MISHSKPVDLRVKKTRMTLQKALMELLNERDFQSITVRDITERAMVNRATFYDHFVDKYALMEAGVREWFIQTLQEKTGGVIEKTPENLAILIEATCEFLARLRHHCLPRMGNVLPMVQSQITTSMAEMLIGCGGDTPLNNQCDSDILRGTMAAWAIYGAALYWSQNKSSETIQTFVARVLPTIVENLDVTQTPSPTR